MNRRPIVFLLACSAFFAPVAAQVEDAAAAANDYFSPLQAGAAPVWIPEVYNKVTGWSLERPHVSPREYHSTAVLLPSGRVVSAGGDTRTSDYEVFTPLYLNQGLSRPKFVAGTTGSTVLSWGTDYGIQHEPLPVGVSISRVVLMRPCSVTHHSDMDQRYVELGPAKFLVVDDDNTVGVRTPNPPVAYPPLLPGTGGNPRGSTVAPPGWYMMFLISSEGVPSVAKWVKLP